MPHPLWTSLGDAPALLASCGANPPKTRVARIVGCSTYHAAEYVGDRVKRLAAIWREEQARLFDEAEASEDYDAFTAHCAFDPQTAIRTAIFLNTLVGRESHATNKRAA